MNTNDDFFYITTRKCDYIDIHPTQFGWQRIKGLPNRNILRDCYVLHIILDGKGCFCSRGKNYELHKNQAFLIKPGCMVSYFSDENEPWEYVWMGFEGKSVENLFKEYNILSDKDVFNIKDSSIFKTIVMPLFSEQAEKKEGILLNHSVVLTYLEEFFKQIDVDDKEDDDKSFLKDAISYIREHYRDSSLSVKTICDKININRTSLFKKFIEKYEVSPQEYIISFRLQMAKSMILESDFSLKVISISCGYNNYEHFSKAFSKKYGLSPKKYKEYYLIHNN